MRTLAQIKASHAVALEQDPDHGGACTPNPFRRRFMQRSLDMISRDRGKGRRRARSKAARRARAVNHG